jgi:putative endonuclease
MVLSHTFQDTMYYVYVLKSKQENKLYTGYSADLKARIESHNMGKNTATKYRRPLELIYYEAYRAPEDAHKRETMLKLNGRAWAQLKQRLEHSSQS